MIFKRKIGKNDQMVIPKVIREMLDIKKGDYVIFEMNENDNEVKIRFEKKYS